MANQRKRNPKPRKREPSTEPTDRGRIKDPSEWVTGDEPMTGAQESYLETLAREAGDEVEPELSKAEASEKIDELQGKTGRGQGSR